MKHFKPKKIFFIALIITICLGQYTTQQFADSSSQPTPTVTVSPSSATTVTIAVHFQRAVPQNDIIDVEVYNSANQRVWQSYTTSGGDSYSATTSQLPQENYTVSVGLFTPNWANNYAWFEKLSPFTILQSNSATPTISVTPTVSVTPSPATSITPVTPTPVVTAQATTDAQTAYNDWKGKYVVTADNALRVARPENNNDTVSEGIGYGMLLSYAAGDQTTFSGLWKYAQKYLDSNGLMSWQISSSGQVIGNGSATDADEDIAYALLKANTKWPGNGYDSGAKQQINAIKAHEVVANLLNPGDNWGNTVTMNPSYLAPSYYKAFGSLTGDSQWNTISDATSNWLVRAANPTTGLVPDWVNADLSSANISWDTNQHDYYYDAIRTPIRLLLDYKTTNDANAQNILSKESTFFAGIGVTKLTAGYTLSGTPLNSYSDTAFRSSYAAAAQINPSSQFAKDMLSNLITTSPTGYFGTSLRTLTLAIIAGQLQ